MDIAIAAFVILLREGFEILLILATIVRVIQSNRPDASLVPIYSGSALGIAINLALGFVIGLSGLHNEFADKAVLLTAAALMLYVARGLLLFRFTGVEKEKILSSRFFGASPAALFVLSFAVIARESFEVLLFLEALSIKAGGWTVAIFYGLTGAFWSLVGIFFMLRSIAGRLPVRLIFALSSIYLIVQSGFFIWEALA